MRLHYSDGSTAAGGEADYVFDLLPSKNLYKLRALINGVLKKRSEDKLNIHDKLYDGWNAFANFMTCAAVAMACRATLRWSKGHEPYGTRPQSGEMWSPSEISKALIDMDGALEYYSAPKSANPLRWNIPSTVQYPERHEWAWFDKKYVSDRWKDYYSDIPF